MTKENKASISFRQAIEVMLNDRAASDPLFSKAYQREGKSIEECCNYIVSEVQRMGVNALTDEEVLGFAVHYYDEADIKVEKAPACKVVVPATPDVVEARKAELQREAEERFIAEQIKKMQAPIKKTKRTTPIATENPTLF